MPSGSFMQVFVRCPFYQFDDGKRRITCEGIIDESNLMLYFRNKADYETQIAVFCCEHYECCEVHRMLMGKYQEEE